MRGSIKRLVDALITAKTLVFDLDGTLTPMDVSRDQSRVPRDALEALNRLREFYKLGIASAKSCRFLEERIPFAHFFICYNGLLTLYNDMVLMSREALFSSKRERLKVVLKEAYNLAKKYELYVEIKELEGVVVGFCLDWRGKLEEPPKELQNLVDFARSMNLRVVDYSGRPFIDVFLADVDKAWALTKLIELKLVERPLIYFGDSENDVPAFNIADLSIQVLHGENKWLDLGADYVIEQKDLTQLLRLLLERKSQI